MKNPLIRPQDISNKYNEVIARNSPEADDEAIPKNKIPSGVYPEQKDKILSAPADTPGEDATPSLCPGLWLRMTSEGLGVISR
jgi:hypothetical protein